MRIAPIAAAAAGVACAAGVWAAAPDRFAAAWATGWLLWAGIAFGSLALTLVGRLLDEPWFPPVRRYLDAATAAWPLLALLALPLLFWADQFYAFPIRREHPLWSSEAFFIGRSAVYLLLWGFAAWLAIGPGARWRPAPLLGLALFIPTATLASIDWGMAMDPEWRSGLFGLAFVAMQTLAALALAVIVADLRAPDPSAERVESAAAALLILAAVTLYLWFAHYLVVWSADLPHEAAWYARRGEGWLATAPRLALLLGAAAGLILLPRRARRMRTPVIVAALLLLAQHMPHFYWLIRPGLDAPAPVAADLLAAASIGLLCWAVYARRADGQGSSAGRGSGGSGWSAMRRAENA